MKLRKERRQRLDDSLDEQRKDEKGDYIPRDFADWREIPSEALQKKGVAASNIPSIGLIDAQVPGGVYSERCAALLYRGNRRDARYQQKCGENAPLARPPSDARRSCTGYRWKLEHRPQ